MHVCTCEEEGEETRQVEEMEQLFEEICLSIDDGSLFILPNMQLTDSNSKYS